MKKVKIGENQKNTESLIKENSKLKLEKLLQNYNTSLEGISIVELDDRIEQYGKNIIDIKENNTLIHRLKESIGQTNHVVLNLTSNFDPRLLAKDVQH